MVNHFKFVIVGDAGVGKSTYISSLMHGYFVDEYVNHTFEVTNKTYLEDSFNIWDTASHEDYSRLRPLSYPATDFFAIMFSLTNPSSLQHILTVWYGEINYHCPNTPIILIGTKSDEIRLTNSNDIQYIKNQINAFDYVEISSLNNTNLIDPLRSCYNHFHRTNEDIYCSSMKIGNYPIFPKCKII